MRRQSTKRKPRSSFLGRLTRAAVLITILPIAALSACATMEMRSMEDVKGLAGTWQGNGYVTDNNFLFMTLVIQENGSYELTGSVESKGMIKIEGNHVEIGPFSLWAYGTGGSRMLQGMGNGARVAFSRRG